MTANKDPFYLKAALVIIGLYFLIDILYLAQFLIVPILFASVIAILLSPLVDFFVRIKFNRVLSIFVSILILFVVGIGAIVLIGMQLGKFSESLPLVLDKSQDLMESSVSWISSTFNVRMETIQSFVEDTQLSLIEGSKNYLDESFLFVGNGLTIIFLVPVYIFMILFYQPLLLDFIRKVFGENNETRVNEVLHSTKRIVQKYLVALLLESLIVAVLNSIGLLIIGVDYAILFGVIGAILNLIPYIGGIVAIALPMLFALATISPTAALLVLILYIIIQFIDNNYILPKLVGSNVKINALVSIVVVIAGGMLWGIPGMFLSIPLTAIVKVIFDHIDPLKPWGFLLGDTMPSIVSFKFKGVLRRGETPE